MDGAATTAAADAAATITAAAAERSAYHRRDSRQGWDGGPAPVLLFKLVHSNARLYNIFKDREVLGVRSQGFTNGQKHVIINILLQFQECDRENFLFRGPELCYNKNVKSV